MDSARRILASMRHTNIRLAAVLGAQRISLRELARRIGVAHGSVRGWLAGRMPAAERRAQVARVLGVDAGWLWGRP